MSQDKQPAPKGFLLLWTIACLFGAKLALAHSSGWVLGVLLVVLGGLAAIAMEELCKTWSGPVAVAFVVVIILAIRTMGSPPPAPRPPIKSARRYQEDGCSMLCDASDPGYNRGNKLCKRNVKTDLKRKMKIWAGIPPSAFSDYEIDHIIPLRFGGSNCVNNLQVLRSTTHYDKAFFEKQIERLYRNKKIGYTEAVARLVAWQP